MALGAPLPSQSKYCLEVGDLMVIIAHSVGAQHEPEEMSRK